MSLCYAHDMSIQSEMLPYRHATLFADSNAWPQKRSALDVAMAADRQE